MTYLVIFEKSKTGYSAYVPNLPGCVATAATKRATKKMISESIVFHLERLRELGKRIPKNKTEAELIEVL